MAWRRTGDKPLSEPMVVSLLTHNCVTRPQWVKNWWHKKMTQSTTKPCAQIVYMVTSSNGNIFRVTGLLCGEFTGHRWIPRTKVSDADRWCFLWSTSAPTVEHKQWRRRWFETPSRSLWRHCNDAFLWFQIPCCRCHLGTACRIFVVISIIYMTMLISKNDVYHMYQNTKAAHYTAMKIYSKYTAMNNVKLHGDKINSMGNTTAMDTCKDHGSCTQGTKGIISHKGSPNRVYVILNAKFRFGSSFVGEMFVRHSKFAYYFEPLYETNASGFKRSDASIARIIKKLFNCSLTSMDIDNGSKNRADWKRTVLCGASLRVGR